MMSGAEALPMAKSRRSLLRWVLILERINYVPHVRRLALFVTVSTFVIAMFVCVYVTWSRFQEESLVKYHIYVFNETSPSTLNSQIRKTVLHILNHHPFQRHLNSS
eukprot:TRINITY_DN3896_c0_g2_i3.p1 TRINITY_DN3896_c0_g2~~TRINITY_DN3896_c0_g2_i3.p1  ORF type:complete len:121 (+),score=2.25 TRINITY_DN3896_c0_g2_i3:46-363(+)